MREVVIAGAEKEIKKYINCLFFKISREVIKATDIDEDSHVNLMISLIRKYNREANKKYEGILKKDFFLNVYRMELSKNLDTALEINPEEQYAKKMKSALKYL